MYCNLVIAFLAMFGIGTLTGAVTVVGELNAGLTENYRLGIRATETRGVPASTPANVKII